MAENKGDDDGSAGSRERLRFQVELTFGETTIVSWKKLLKEARKRKEGQSSGGPHSSSSVVPEILRNSMGTSNNAGQSSDTVIGNKRAKDVATSSDQVQQSKHKVKMPKIGGEKYEVDLSNKFAGLMEMNAKTISKTKSMFEHTSPPAMVNIHPPEKLQANNPPEKLPATHPPEKLPPTYPPEKLHATYPPEKQHATHLPENIHETFSPIKLQATYCPEKLKATYSPVKLQATKVNAPPVLTYSRKPADSRSKSKGPPLDAVEDLRGFPSKTMYNAVQKNEKVSSKKSGMIGVGGSSYDELVHQKAEACFPLKINSTSEKLLHDDVSSKIQHKDKSGGSRELLDAIPPYSRSALKDSKARKFKEIKNEIFSMVSNQPIAEREKFADGYSLSVKLEDKLCDLYELCLQGLAGDKDVQVQEFHKEVVELWPKGVMDHQKLTEAISRAKRRRAIAAKNQGRNLVDDVKTKHFRPPSQKRKVTDLSNSPNSIPPFSRKMTSKKAAAKECGSSESHPKVNKLTLKQKPLVPERTNMKVRFLMKKEHETFKPDEKAMNEVLNQSSIGASATCNGQLDSPYP